MYMDIRIIIRIVKFRIVLSFLHMTVWKRLWQYRTCMYGRGGGEGRREEGGEWEEKWEEEKEEEEELLTYYHVLYVQ